MNNYTYNPYFDVYSNYLAHHGIKGMRWGVRRYQPYQGQAPNGSKEIGQATKVKQRSDKKLPFYGKKSDNPKTLFYGTRKKKLIKESMKSTKDSGLSRKERKIKAKKYAESELAKKYGESNKTYKKVDKAYNTMDKAGRVLQILPMVATGAAITTLYVAAKKYGDKPLDVIKNNIPQSAIDRTIRISAAIPLGAITSNVIKKQAVKAEDKYYE